MKENGAYGFSNINDPDVIVIRKILKKHGSKKYLVRFIDKGGDGYNDEFKIYVKNK